MIELDKVLDQLELHFELTLDHFTTTKEFQCSLDLVNHVVFNTGIRVKGHHASELRARIGDDGSKS